MSDLPIIPLDPQFDTEFPGARSGQDNPQLLTPDIYYPANKLPANAHADETARLIARDGYAPQSDYIYVGSNHRFRIDSNDALIAERWDGSAWTQVSVVSDSNTPYLHVGNNNAQSIPNNATTVIVWNNITADNFNGYNSITGIYTVPEDGIYTINASLMYSENSWDAGEFGAIQLYVDNILKATAERTEFSATVTTFLSAVTSITLSLSTGQEVDVRTIHRRGAATTLYQASGDSDLSYNYLTLAKVGTI